MAESEEELKSLLMKVESEKVGLKLNIQKTKIMASSPITSWELDGETVERMSDFIFWGSKITADGDCSHEIKRRLLFGMKVMTNLDSILKSRDITLPTKVHLVKAMVFLVVMYECESWTVKKAERWRINAFQLWCWRRLLRVPWTSRRSNQSILKEINLGCSLEGLMLKLETPILWPPRAKSWLIGEDSDSGRDWGQEEKGTTEDEMAGWHHRLDEHEFGWTSGVGDGQEGLSCCSSWGHKESDILSGWTELKWLSMLSSIASVGAVPNVGVISLGFPSLSNFDLLSSHCFYSFHSGNQISLKNSFPDFCSFSIGRLVWNKLSSFVRSGSTQHIFKIKKNYLQIRNY